jgi:HK97 family phage major capsid protein
MSDVDKLGEDIKRVERAEQVETELRLSTKPAESAQPGSFSDNSEKSVEQHAKAYRKAWADYLRNGENPNPRAQRTSLGRHGAPGMSNKNKLAMEEVRKFIAGFNPENRAEEEGNLLNQIGTYTGLGFFVPAGFVYDVETATKWYAPLMDGAVFQILETATGQPLPYPTSNDTAQAARVIGESQDVTSGSTDVSASHVNLAAYKYTTDLIKVSIELLQDSAFNIESFLAERFAIRLGRGYERDLTNGDGSSKPTGLLTDVAASGAVAITANGSSESSGGSETGANSVGYTDLVRLEHSVDPSYRRGAKFMFHDTTLSYLKRILDKFGRPLWTPGMKDGAPDTIVGYPYVINQSVPQIAAGNTVVAFGDMKKFLVRKVKDLSVLRLDERYAEFGQIAYVAFSRIDSRLIDAGTHPVNVLKNHT